MHTARLKNIFLLFFILSIRSVSAQTDSAMQHTMQEQANNMVYAFVNGDYNRLLDFTYPELISIAGGRDILKDLIASTISDILAQGFTIDSARVGTPGKIYIAGNEIHSTIDQFIYLGFPGGHMTSESALLAVSQDGGKKWYFLDFGQLTPELKASFFPDFNNDLVIPEAKQPVIVYDEE